MCRIKDGYSAFEEENQRWNQKQTKEMVDDVSGKIMQTTAYYLVTFNLSEFKKKRLG